MQKFRGSEKLARNYLLRKASLSEELAKVGSEQMCAYEPYHLNKNKTEK